MSSESSGTLVMVDSLLILAVDERRRSRSQDEDGKPVTKGPGRELGGV